MEVHPRLPEAVAAALEALFHGAADAHELRPGLLHDVAQAPHGLAVGHEVVHHQHPVPGVEPLPADQKGDLLFISIREDVALIQAALDVVALGLFGEDHGLAEVAGHHGRQGDAAGLGGEDDIHAVHVEVPSQLLGDVVHQLRVHAVVQESVHLDDVSREDLTLLDDAVFQLLHSAFLLISYGYPSYYVE